MNDYEINRDTLAIMPLDDYKSKVIEKNKTFVVEKTPMGIIDNSCRFFGSSYQGRFEGTKRLIGISHKAPIIIEESSEMIFFPTNSPRLYECSWISLKNLDKYKKNSQNTTIMFTNGHLLDINIPYGIIDNQVLRATRLESVLRVRKNTNY